MTRSEVAREVLRALAEARAVAQRHGLAFIVRDHRSPDDAYRHAPSFMVAIDADEVCVHLGDHDANDGTMAWGGSQPA